MIGASVMEELISKYMFKIQNVAVAPELNVLNIGLYWIWCSKINYGIYIETASAVNLSFQVTWLACWIENIAGAYKYVMLNAATRLKGEKDWQKYETARKLKECVDTIRDSYKADWKSKEMRVRQRGVAMYFIDKLALRAGHEKEEGESADTVGCCSLRYEHIS